MSEEGGSQRLNDKEVGGWKRLTGVKNDKSGHAF
jgi:hypothetical protein